VGSEEKVLKTKPPSNQEKPRDQFREYRENDGKNVRGRKRTQTKKERPEKGECQGWAGDKDR